MYFIGKKEDLHSPIIADDGKTSISFLQNLTAQKQKKSVFVFTYSELQGSIDDSKFTLEPGSTAVFGKGKVKLKGDFVGIENSDHLFPTQINPKMEESGRLAYINGAHDTLLIHPFRYGVACLNVMYFPPGIVQEKHTHPSFRVGIVVKGKGSCFVEDKEFELDESTIIYMDTGTPHYFVSKSNLIVITYHPDSNFGPTDEDHPMINRTIVKERPVLESKPGVHTLNFKK